MDTAKLLTDLGISFTVGGKNSTRHGLSVRCPFCNDPSNHGSFHDQSLHYLCWRCPGGSGMAALMALSRQPREVIRKALFKCGGNPVLPQTTTIYANSLDLPGGPINERHRQYLLSRGFDPDTIIRNYGIRGTTPFDKFEGVPYPNRIIIPIYDLSGELISFQGRDITGAPGIERYKVCPLSKAKMHYKDVVYAGNLAKGRRVVVVEGVMDVWKLGINAVATFGTSLKKSQLLALSNWPEVIFFFDPEPDAQAKAKAYAKELALYGVKTSVAYEDFGILSNGKARDVGDLMPNEITRIRGELGI